MTSRGLGRDQIHEAAWGRERYPHPLISCMMPLVAVLFVMALGIGGFLFWKNTLPGSVNIPNVVGLPQEKALRQLHRVGLATYIVKERETSEKIPRGAVISLQPRVGRNVKEGRTVRMLISAGSAFTRIPDVVNMPQEAAREKLAKLGLQVAKEQYVFDEKYSIDRIISISPRPNTKVSRRSTVSLTISKGGQPDETLATDDEEGQDYRTSVLSLTLPEEATGPAEVHIDVTDDLGKRTVYREVHQPGDSIVTTIEGTGDSTAQVYFGDALLLTRKF